MGKSVTYQITLEMTPEDEKTLEQMFAEMQQMDTRIQRNQADIDRLKAETRDIREDTKKVREEGRKLQAELDTNLNRLKAIVPGHNEYQTGF